MESKIKNVRNEGLDKFYTNTDYAKQCISELNLNDYDFVIEPSAGCGNFFNQIEHHNKIGLDILPENNDNNLIICMDFFNYTPNKIYNKILVIGNPPFGKSCSTAIKFFNHAAKWADTIAFIIPRTFRKISVQNKLDKNFHLISDKDTPTNPCCFTPKMMVKCCFQIWQKSNELRPIIHLPTEHPDWTFLSFGPLDKNNQPTPPKNADFALRAYGGKIGEILKINLETLRPKSWHWIKSNIDIDVLISRFEKLNYSNSSNTARQNSMGRAELVNLYSEMY
jgi:hypothetical protein